MKIMRAPHREVKLYVGGRYGYHGKKFTEEHLHEVIGGFYRRSKAGKITCRVTPTCYLYGEWTEPGWEVAAINYPRFPATEEELKKFMHGLAEYLCAELRQHRVGYHDGKDFFVLEGEEAEYGDHT